MSGSPGLISIARRLLSLSRPHLPLLGLAGVAMVVVGAGTATYAWLMGPALRFLLGGGAEVVLPAAGAVSRADALWLLPALIVGVGVVKGVGYLVQFYLAGLFGQRVVMDLRRALFAKVTTLTGPQRQTLLSGDLLGRFTTDVAAVELAATYTLPSWIKDTASIIALAVVAVVASPLLAGVSAVLVPVAVIPVVRLTRALAARTREGQAALGMLAGQVKEGLEALRTVQAFNAEAVERERFARRVGDVERALTRAAWARAGVPGIMEVLASVAIAASLVVGMESGLAPERLVSFLAALVLLYQPVKDLGRVSQFLTAAAASLDRVDHVLSMPGEVPAGGTRPVAPLADAIELVDVCYTYPGAAHPALDGVRLTIRKGEVTAVVGRSGSGKSTLAAILLRLLPQSSGSIRFDGVEVEALALGELRSRFALVTQDPLLFSATVAENLRLARPEATPEALEQACRAAQAHDFVMALPAGYDTPLGERGVKLSVGQRQRLCLARALLLEDAVLVLDEATSSLDPRAEAEIDAALEAVLPGRTAVIIAHRLSTVRGADRIAVMDGGRVVEQGTHHELLASGGAYASMWRAHAA